MLYEVITKPRYIRINVDKESVVKAMEDCNVYVGDEFNLGLAKRKAIYKNYPEALPDVPVVDAERNNFV